MEFNELYNTAKKLAEDVKNITSSPSLKALTVLLTEDKDIFAGVNGIKIINGEVSASSPEYNAVISMKAEGRTVVEKALTISLSDMKIIPPCEECVGLLIGIDEKNEACEIAVSEDKSLTADSDELPEFFRKDTFEDEAEAAEEESKDEASSNSPFMDISDFNPESADFGFGDFEETPPPEAAHPVKVIGQPDEKPAESKAEDENKPAENAQPVNNGMPMNNNMYNGMNPQYMQQGQQGMMNGYPYPMQQGMNPQQGINSQYMQQGQQQGMMNGYPYPMQQGMNPQYMQQGQQQGMMNGYPYPMQQGMNPQYMQQGQQQMNQGFPQAQPYYQQQINSQPLQAGAYPQQGFYNNTSSKYQQSGNISKPLGQNSGSISVPIPTSGGNSAFSKRLSSFMNDENVGKNSDPEAMNELEKQARERKKLAKVNNDFKKKMKDLGY
ncbi:MAG: hypothetical protein IKQ90_04005 [Ruminococcus sp.]|nr:hypothetical protein [Ruminococcus sp.]